MVLNTPFGDGTLGTIEIGNTLDKSLENLEGRLNTDFASLNVNGSSVLGQWKYSVSGKKLVWTSDSANALRNSHYKRQH